MPVERDKQEADNGLQGTYSSGGQLAWRSARAATTGKSSVGNSKRCQTDRTTLGNGRVIYSVDRLVYYFDTSGVDKPLQRATLKVSLASADFGGGTGRFIIVPHTPDNINRPINGADIDAIPGVTDFRLSMAGQVTPYSNIVTLSESDTEAKFNLTPAAKAQMLEDDKVSLMVVEYTHDYLASAPASDLTMRIVTAASGVTGELDLVFKATGTQMRNFKRVVKTKGSRGRGFKAIGMGATTGGKTVANGFGEF
tara:strand:+ start:67 stop:825 length:759 start_codon:yes stop_codon:yes gene_type:complete